MNPREFWHEYSFAEIQVRIFYHYKNKREEMQNSWEQTRWISYSIFRSQSPKDSKLKATDIMEFEWDKKDKISEANKPMTKEDIKEIFKAHKLFK